MVLAAFHYFGLVFCLLLPYACSKSFSCDSDNVHDCLLKLLLSKHEIPVKLKVENGWQMVQKSPNIKQNSNIVWRSWRTIEDSKKHISDNSTSETRPVPSGETEDDPFGVEPKEQDGTGDEKKEGTMGNATDKTVCVDFTKLHDQLRDFELKYYRSVAAKPYSCCNSNQHLRFMVDFFKNYRTNERKRPGDVGPDTFCFREDVVPIIKKYQADRRVETDKRKKCRKCNNYNYLKKFTKWYKQLRNNDDNGPSASEKGPYDGVNGATTNETDTAPVGNTRGRYGLKYTKKGSPMATEERKLENGGNHYYRKHLPTAHKYQRYLSIVDKDPMYLPSAHKDQGCLPVAHKDPSDLPIVDK
ncbi:uncharacterized protein LOC108740062 isoform X2 [Agrilus planipennis]|uniref:Uncharacterized protein LOC108740062 isoform X2 n=1 Tax=Agrilus planipennis TaxID=224129 RepID=A0A1W4X0Y1_AGRPL|nr:uncharacterized protein LOC108740062 isoform X2 [Agrilus planipennis]